MSPGWTRARPACWPGKRRRPLPAPSEGLVLIIELDTGHRSCEPTFGVMTAASLAVRMRGRERPRRGWSGGALVCVVAVWWSVCRDFGGGGAGAGCERHICLICPPGRFEITNVVAHVVGRSGLSSEPRSVLRAAV